MPIKKTKLSRKSKNKKFIKKIKSSKKTQKNKKMRHNTRTKSSKNKYKHRGGFTSNCNMATVKEPGFSIDAIGSIAGINIPSSRAAIYRPNCKTSSGSGSSYSDAMIP
jgi:hypothetical protein